MAKKTAQIKKTKKTNKNSEHDIVKIKTESMDNQEQELDVYLKPQNTSVTLSHFEEFQKVNSAEHTTIHLTIKGLSRQMDARFAEAQAKVDARFTESQAQMDARFAEVHIKIDALENKMDARFAEAQAKSNARFVALEDIMDRGFAKSHELYHRLLLIVEEQNSKNNFMFDHLNMLYDRLTKHEHETKENFKNFQRPL